MVENKKLIQSRAVRESWKSEVCREELKVDLITSLGHLLQCLTTLTVKGFFLMLKWNLLYFSLCPLPLALSLSTTEKSLGASLYQIFIHADKTPWTCSSPGWKIQTLSASSHTSDAAAPSPRLWPCTGLIPTCPCLSGTEKPQHSIPGIFPQGWVERKDHLPWPADNVLSSIAQEVPGCLCCRWFLLPCGQCVHPDPQCHVSPELLWGQPHRPPVCEVFQPHVDNLDGVQPTTWGAQKSARPDWRLSPLSLWLEVEHLPKKWEA